MPLYQVIISETLLFIRIICIRHCKSTIIKNKIKFKKYEIRWIMEKEFIIIFEVFCRLFLLGETVILIFMLIITLVLLKRLPLYLFLYKIYCLVLPII